MKTLTSAVLALAVMTAPAHAGLESEVDAVVRNTVESVLKILKDEKKSDEQMKEAVMKIVDPVFDFELIAKLVLGRKHWGAFKPAQRKAFTDLFVKQLRDSYFEKVDILSDEKVEYEKPKKAAKNGRKATMLTHIVAKDERYDMLYKLYKGKKKGAAWKVYDVEIEGISLVKSYGAQYDQFLQKSSPDELLKKMKEKVLDTPDDLKKAEKKAKEKKKEKKD